MKTPARFATALALASALPFPAVAVADGRLSPEVLPGGGLKAHSFVYAGEWDSRKPDAQSLFVVRDGKIAWSTHIPQRAADGRAQEFDDAALLPNGNLVFAQMSGAGEITPEHRMVWFFSAPTGTETHSIQPIGRDLVLIAQNANPAFALIIDTAKNQVVRRIPVPTTTRNTHGQFRHIRMTAQHTILIPLLSENRVAEFDLDGHETWSVPAQSPWSALRLRNGDTLIAGDAAAYVREVGPRGATVWEFTQADVPAIRLFNTQTAYRLANGNTIVCNWVAGHKPISDWPDTVQALEVTPDKRLVWALRSWQEPADLGPATHLQILGEPLDEETINFRPD
jgi:hypothetical protein